MKLLDLLVKKTNEEGWGWPGKSTFCYQTKPEHGYITKFFDRNGVKVVDYCWEKCDDASVFNELTKEQYDSALAASEGWIEWGGGQCPVPESVNVDVKLEDGSEKSDAPACSFIWQHSEDIYAIIAYRLHKPEINSRANDDRLEQDLNECIGQDVDMPEWSGEGLPPVGCECLVSVDDGENWTSWYTMAQDSGVVIFGYLDGDHVAFGKKDMPIFRPLRTEAEKARDSAVDAMQDYFPRGGWDYDDICSLYDAIAVGKIPGVKLEIK